MGEVRWTAGAKADLQEIVEYIARDSATYATSTANRITAAAEHLRTHPRLGRIVPEYHDTSIRELIVPPYRVVYQTRGGLVGIVAVVHGSRDLPGYLGDEPPSSD